MDPLGNIFFIQLGTNPLLGDLALRTYGFSKLLGNLNRLFSQKHERLPKGCRTSYPWNLMLRLLQKGSIFHYHDREITHDSDLYIKHHPSSKIISWRLIRKNVNPNPLHNPYKPYNHAKRLKRNLERNTPYLLGSPLCDFLAQVFFFLRGGGVGYGNP